MSLKLKMKVMDRLVIGSLCPEKGNLFQQTIVRDIMDKVKITQKEFTENKIKVTEIGVQFKPEDDFEIEVEFEKAEVNLMKAYIDTMNDKGTITQQNISLCLRVKHLKMREEEEKEVEKKEKDDEIS